MATTWYEQGVEAGMEKGMALGIEKGIEQGIEKGIEQGGRELVFRAIEDRFGTVDDQSRAFVAGWPESQLVELLKAVYRAESIEEFLQCQPGK